MGMFVKTGREGISIEGSEDIIYIVPKMNFGTRQKVLSALLKLSMQEDEGQRANFDLGAYNLALMEHNIVGWEGPSFAGMPFSRDRIRQLDQENPLVTKVLEEIRDRNVMKGQPDPNSLEVPTSSGEPGSEESTSGK